ncbi:hypothetical protein [Variovorax sp. HJSM1_2]|uniref:hypothetical protein n=1 Tax=Variovorax sp. HJSM1_2 TaxID=3366263 RepID=UPI003BD9E53D
MNTKTKTPTAEAANTAAETRQPLPVPPGGWPADEFTGIGGDYVRDPYTGVRTKAQPPAEDAAPVDA